MTLFAADWARIGYVLHTYQKHGTGEDRLPKVD